MAATPEELEFAKERRSNELDSESLSANGLLSRMTPLVIGMLSFIAFQGAQSSTPETRLVQLFLISACITVLVYYAIDFTLYAFGDFMFAWSTAWTEIWLQTLRIFVYVMSFITVNYARLALNDAYASSDAPWHTSLTFIFAFLIAFVYFMKIFKENDAPTKTSLESDIDV